MLLMTDPHSPRQNHLLDDLTAAEYKRLFPHLELVSMPLGAVLYESGGELRHAYFPTTCIVSMLYVMEDGASAEIAVVGNEGIIGVALFMGGDTMPNRTVVQSAGYAYRLRGHLFMQEFNRYGALLRLLLRYTQTLITQTAQTAVCNRHHSGDQQLCRWLLLSLDRLSGNELVHDPGIDRQYAGRAARRRHGGCWEIAASGIDPLQTWPHDGTGPAGIRSAGLRVLPSGQNGI